MVLLIDNYDSFSYNLYQLIATLQPDIRVIRNDEMTVNEIEELAPSHIVLSPGPGKPRDAGACEDVVRYLGSRYPVLGVCLGHQAICEAYGATITYADRLMHGKQSEITVEPETKLFRGLERQIKVARYHSLVADKKTIPEELVVTAVTKEGEIMAVAHKKYHVYGVQFHPESILTQEGKQIIANFTERCPIIKAIRVAIPEDVQGCEMLPADYLLFDTYSQGAYGGSGTCFDWELIKHVKCPYFLAGGIHADNVGEAIRRLTPYVIDVSSGVETDGYKDRAKILNIVERVRGGLI